MLMLLDVVAGLILGVAFKLFFDSARNAWLRRKTPPAALAWMTTRRLFGPKTEDVVAEMALEVSTHVVFDKLAVALAQRSGQVFESVAADASRALLDMKARGHALDGMVAAFEARSAAALAKLDERLEIHVAAQNQLETSAMEHLQITLDAISKMLQSMQVHAQVATDKVATDASTALESMRGTFSSRMQEALQHVQITGAEAVVGLEAHTREQADLMLALVKEDVGQHASAARGLLDAQRQDNTEVTQALREAVSVLLERSGGLLDEVFAKATASIGQVSMDASNKLDTRLKKLHAELETHTKQTMQAHTAHAAHALQAHEAHVNTAATELFKKLDVKTANMEKEVQAKSEKVLDQMHTRIRERMPNPFLPAPAIQSASADAQFRPQRR